jgi:drug/metabolite transporter (DMT)-like permease
MSLVNAMLWRYAVAAIMMLALLYDVSRLDIGRSRILKLLALGSLGQAVITYSSLYALRYIAVGPLAFLFYTYPAWIAVVAAIRRTEPLTPIRTAALVTALVGLGIMVGAPGVGTLAPVGVTIALATALLYSLYLPALESAQRGMDPIVSSFYLIMGVMVTFIIVGSATGQLTPPHSISLWGYVFLLALVCTVLAFRALIGGLRVLGPVRTSIISTVEPFFTALLGAVILGDRFTGETWLGGALIATAVLLLQWRDDTGPASVLTSKFP